MSYGRCVCFLKFFFYGHLQGYVLLGTKINGIILRYKQQPRNTKLCLKVLERLPAGMTFSRVLKDWEELNRRGKSLSVCFAIRVMDTNRDLITWMTLDILFGLCNCFPTCRTGVVIYSSSSVNKNTGKIAVFVECLSY